MTFKEFEYIKSVLKYLFVTGVGVVLVGCSTPGTLKNIAFDGSKPIQFRVKKAIDAMCLGVFDNNAEIANWYADYGTKAVANARGYSKRVTNIVRSAKASRPLFEVEERDLFSAQYSALQDSFEEYKVEILKPLSGEMPKKCGESIYCHEQSFKALQQRADELELSLPAIRARGIGDVLGPISVLINKAAGVATGSCKNNMIRSMEPEFDEISALKLPDSSGV